MTGGTVRRFTRPIRRRWGIGSAFGLGKRVLQTTRHEKASKIGTREIGHYNSFLRHCSRHVTKTPTESVYRSGFGIRLRLTEPRLLRPRPPLP